MAKAPQTVFLQLSPPLNMQLLPTCLKRPFVARGQDAHRVALPVRGDRQLDEVPGTLRLQVRDEFVGGVVLRVGPHIAVDLVHRLDAG